MPCEHEYEKVIDVPFDREDVVSDIPEGASNFHYWFLVCTKCGATAEWMIFDLPDNTMGMQAVEVADWNEDE